MLISQEVWYVSPGIELVRNGDQVTFNLSGSADGYYDEELGYWQWYGEMELSLGEQYDYIYQDADRPMDLSVTGTLTPGVVTSGYFNIYGAPSAYSIFNVILFDTAATYAGTAEIDYVFGSSQGDSFSGGLGDDGFEGGLGNDWLNGGQGGDLLDGGAGRDTASYAGAAAGVVARLYDAQLNDGEALGDRYLSIEALEGSGYNDRLYGDGAVNTLFGRDGADTLFGLGGADTLVGGAGADKLLGGNGIDTASYAWAGQGVSASLNAGAGTAGEALGDTYTSIENLVGTAFDDVLFGDAGANTLTGNAGDDTFRGLGGNDRLIGGAGDDRLFGGDDDDLLAGGAGADQLDGGAGRDAFLFDTALDPLTNVDRILNYSVADDRIRLDDAVFTELTPGAALAGAAFHIGTAATTAAHRIIYNDANGLLLYDSDGAGGSDAIAFARVGSGLALTSGEFFVV